MSLTASSPRKPLIAGVFGALALHLAAFAFTVSLDAQGQSTVALPEQPFEVAFETVDVDHPDIDRAEVEPADEPDARPALLAAAKTAKASAASTTSVSATSNSVAEAAPAPKLVTAVALPESTADTVTSGSAQDAALDGLALTGRGTDQTTAIAGGGLSSVGNGSAPGKSAARKARLLSNGPGCSDLFPYGASGESRVLTVELKVEQDGHAQMVRARDVRPDEAAFEAAARICSGRLRFAPAQDRLGVAVEAHAVVRLRFERS